MATVAQAGQRIGTFSALRSTNFRTYILGQLVSLSGTWMQTVAQGYLVFSLTRSEAWLGIIALVAGLPSVLLAPITGVVIERMPRRRLLLILVFIQMLLAFVMTALTASGLIQVWHILLLAFFLGCANAFDAPTRLSFVVEMVGKEDLQSGIALNSILNSATRVLGPMTAGLLLVQLGVVWCFFLNGLSFVAVIASLIIMKVPYARPTLRDVRPLQMLREGLSFVRHDITLAPLLMLSACGGFFLVPIIQILPAYADVVLHSPKEGYAALSAMQGLGSVVGGLIVGGMALWLGRGRLIAASAGLASAALVGMALQTAMIPAILFALINGVFMVMFFVSINTQIQMSVPDSFRGRVSSLYTLTFIGLTPFGSFALGALAEWMGTPAALSLWGVVSALMLGLILLRFPHLLGIGKIPLTDNIP